jgi:hypothetical protein
MSSHRSRARRGLLFTVAALSASAAVGAGTASAAITSTAVTSPSGNPFHAVFDDNAATPPTITIAGTTNSTAPATDTVDIYCTYYEDGEVDDNTVDTNVALDSSGAFSDTVSFDDEGNCTLRAVPHMVDPGDVALGQYTGPLLENDYTELDYVSGTSGPLDDFFFTGSSTSGYADFDSVGDCALDDSSAEAPNNNYAEDNSWACAAALYNDDFSATRASQSEIQVDGQNAYDTQGAKDLYGGADTATGFQGLTTSYSKDNSTDNVTISDNEPLMTCPTGSAFPATSTNCATFSSAGVTLARSITETQNGQVVTIADTYQSTDGRAHTVNLEYDNDYDENGPTGADWKFPGTSGYESYAPGDIVTLPSSSTNVIEVDDAFDTGTLLQGPAAIVYSTQPTGVEFASGDGEPLVKYSESVPAAGSVTLTQTYVTATDQATLDKLVNPTIEQTHKPVVAITGPAANAVTQSAAAQVTGTASAYAGLSLKVNGQTVPVNPDGTWSTVVALARRPRPTASCQAWRT